MAVVTLPGEISPDQEKAIVALINQPTIGKAAEESGVGERTLYRWLNEQTFKSAYREARKEAFRHAIAMTQKLAPLAVQTLAKIMTDINAPHTARATAANSLLKFSRESLEIDELSARIETLESAATQKPWTPHSNTFAAPAAA